MKNKKKMQVEKKYHRFMFASKICLRNVIIYQTVFLGTPKLKKRVLEESVLWSN